jgi:hypothetical protein
MHPYRIKYTPSNDDVIPICNVVKPPNRHSVVKSTKKTGTSVKTVNNMTNSVH